MQLLLGFCLLFFLNFAEVEAASLDILVNQQKVALPYWHFKGKKQHGVVAIINGEQDSEGSELVNSLGKALAKHGWSVALLNTSLQIPVPWTEQLPETLTTLRKKNSKRMVVIHYGSQLKNSVNYFTQLQSKQASGLVLLSAFDHPENKEVANLIKKIPFPVLDITGQFDYTPVLEQASIRQLTIKNERYLHRRLPGANHDYAYSKNILVAIINGWMKKLKSARPVKAPIILDKSIPNSHQ
ncbi:hypothetical protein clem_03660 [Legionella clemsonensis]|uniref:ATPases involved in biogenesis of archaeal flagella n=2 Tax=Legionella clemsonensis TaxID=1867846 RepID=A0A222P0C4_9GAMM|nr:hypothetical protein clem_03660 [Legionella clemsonensis]